MCGVVGLFVGCSALTVCPMTMFAADRGADRDTEAELEYRSPFGNWFDRATVRKAPRRLLEPEDAGRYPFSPDLVPLAAHPLVRALPPRAFERVLIQHLYRYLDFTAKLEHLVVNRTVLGIAHDTIGVELPEAMRFDAYKIYCDEAFHALFSADLARQVR
jgi:hypothetical protein